MVDNNMNSINPWGPASIDNYAKLFEEFGIRPFNELLPLIKKPHRYMRRGIIFGHRSYNEVVDAMNNNAPFSAMSGFMPSGPAHLGHKMVMEELIWHQEQGASIFLGIADREAHSVRNIPWEKCRKLGVNEYILSAIALGFKADKGHFYFQSKNDDVKDLAFELGCKANFSELSAIYGFSGETHISHMLSAVTQSADILHPQLPKYGGPRPVVIPVGADQDPHIRLTRGLADKMNLFHIFPGKYRFPDVTRDMVTIYAKRPANELVKPPIKDAFDRLAESLRKIASKEDLVNSFTGHITFLCVTSDVEKIMIQTRNIATEIETEFGGYAFVPPASTYHKFMSGLQGGKMSSSIPDSVISLGAPPKEEAKKVKKARTGGCISLEEQKKEGGKPEECTVYELLTFHLLEDDRELEEIYLECTGGTRMCGHCKKYAAELTEQFLEEHQEKRELAREHLLEYNIKV